jgi:hypothetical protein
MSLRCLNASELPGNIGEISGPILDKGYRFRPEDTASSLFLNRIVLNYRIRGKESPFGCSCVELGESKGRLVEGMKEDVFGDLVGDIEGLLDESSGQFEFLEDFSPLVVLLEDYVVDLLGSQQQFIKLQGICPSNNKELLVIIGCIWIEIDPLELDDSIRIHPLGRYFGIQSKLPNLDGSELVEIFGGGGVEEHADLG